MDDGTVHAVKKTTKSDSLSSEKPNSKTGKLFPDKLMELSLIDSINSEIDLKTAKNVDKEREATQRINSKVYRCFGPLALLSVLLRMINARFWSVNMFKMLHFHGVLKWCRL